MQEDRNNGTITRLSYGEREYILVGTAHVSRESVEEVRQTINDLQPDRVCVELDQGRYQNLTQEQNWQELDLFKVIKEKKAFLLLGSLVLSASQRRLGLDLGVKPGAEMKEAIDCAEEAGIPVSLIDREIQTTLRRAWGLSSLWGKNKLLASLLSSAFSNEKLSQEDLEKMKDKSVLHSMLEEIADYHPAAKKVLIDERDEYLAKKLFSSAQAGEKQILAVVGAGHVPGMIRWLEELHAAAGQDPAEAQNPDSSQLDVVPPPSVLGKVLAWLVPIAIVVLIVQGFFSGDLSQGLVNFGRWFLVNGSLSALGTALALGHPLTILTALVGAPLAVLHPTIGIGFVTGLVQAALGKPRVADFENLQHDILSLKGFYRNRVTRVLLVFLLSSIGSMLGTFVAIPLLFPA